MIGEKMHVIENCIFEGTIRCEYGFLDVVSAQLEKHNYRTWFSLIL